MLRAEGVIRTGSLVPQKRQRSELGYIPAKSGIAACPASGREPNPDLGVHDKGSFHGRAPHPHLNVHETAAFHGQAPDPDLNVHGTAAFHGRRADR